MTEMDSDEFDQLQNRLTAYYETEHYEEGERLARRALIDHPDDPDILGWVASFVGVQERLTEAGEFIDRALRLRPDDDRLLWIKSGLAYRGDDPEQAMAASRAALELEPEDVDNLVKQAGLLIMADQIDDSRALLRRALALDPDNPEPHRMLAAGHLRDHDWAAAEDAFGEALRVDPDDGESWHGLGVARMTRNKVRASQTAFTAALGCDPNGNAAYYLAWPISHAHYRSRWLQPLIVLLLVCVPITGPVGPLLRVTAAALLLGSIVDAVLWLFLGGTLSWRALLARTRGQKTVTVLCFAALITSLAMLGVAVETGSTTLAWRALIPVAALWVLNLVDTALGPDDEETRTGIVARTLSSVEYTIGLDLKGLRRRVRTLSRGGS